MQSDKHGVRIQALVVLGLLFCEIQMILFTKFSWRSTWVNMYTALEQVVAWNRFLELMLALPWVEQ